MSAFLLQSLKRLVVKVGSAMLVDERGNFDRSAVQRLADDVAALRAIGHEVLVVSSGAVAIGCSILNIRRSRARLEELQAAAAAGQVQLVQAWQEGLAKHELLAAQILLTPDDSEQRRRFINARDTLNRLLALDVVPIINENDTVATDELRYGDNDRLAARVAQMVMADGLILLSDVDGLYTSDPTADSSASHVSVVQGIDDRIVAMAGDSGSALGSGGMRTKVEAAKIATLAGCTTVIANGRRQRAVSGLDSDTRFTVFAAVGTPAVARKQWLAGRLEVCGRLQIDAGAVAALGRGSSLLPVGVVAVRGEFQRGDAVALIAPDDLEIGRGIAAFDSEDIVAIKGSRSEDIESRLGYRLPHRSSSVVVHRDDLFMYQT